MYNVENKGSVMNDSKRKPSCYSPAPHPRGWGVRAQGTPFPSEACLAVYSTVAHFLTNLCPGEDEVTKLFITK